MQFKTLRFFLEGSVPYKLRWEKGGSECPSDSPATFGRANACFPNLGLTVLIVIFW